MSDERLDILSTPAPAPAPVPTPAPASEPAPVRISSIKISNYRYFHGDFELAVNGKNLLMYGENGSGKSSIYRAMGYLAKTQAASIADDVNIFAGAEEPTIDFGFSNTRHLIIDRDFAELPEGFDFLRGLSVLVPLLDYKKLLKVHYSSDGNNEQMDLYSMLREIFKDYPYEKGKTISQITDYLEYFNKLSSIVNGDLLGEINELIGYFDKDFKIIRFSFKVTTTDKGLPDPSVTLDIDFKDNAVPRYHQFLNEARLTALAISIYFAAIKRILGSLDKTCLKVLVLDDLLISLDMSNRLCLIAILKAKFPDFQIFFFTHDKNLFDICKDKIDWEKYEIYPDEVSGIPKPMLSLHKSELQRAKEEFTKNHLDSCLWLLRKSLERFLHSFLPSAEQRNKYGDELDLSSLVTKAIAKSVDESKTILEKVNSDRKYLYNPACHHDESPQFKEEVRTAIIDLERLITIQK